MSRNSIASEYNSVNNDIVGNIIYRLEKQGVSFIPVNLDVKRPILNGWTERPHTAKRVLTYHTGVGILTGKYSSNVICFDLDERFGEFLATFPELRNTFIVRRDNAPDRGKLFLKIVDRLPRSTAWCKDGNTSPSMELLSTGRQAVVYGTHPSGAEYKNNGCDIKTTTLDQVSAYWRKWTGTELNSATRVKTSTEYDHIKSEAGNMYAIAVKAHWDCLGVFEYHNRTADIVQKRDGNKKLRGNGGLFVTDDHQWFYSHTKNIGGDTLDAWYYVLHGTKITTKEQFTETCKQMLEAIGETLPFVKRDLSFDPIEALLWAANPKNYPSGRKNSTLRSIMLAAIKTMIDTNKPVIGFSVREASEKAGIGYIAALNGLHDLRRLKLLERVTDDGNLSFDVETNHDRGIANSIESYKYKLTDQVKNQLTETISMRSILPTTEASLDIVSGTCMDAQTLIQYADSDAFQHGSKVANLSLGRAALDVIAALQKENEQPLAQLADATGRSQSTCAEKLKSLILLGIVEVYSVGKAKHYYLVSAWQDILDKYMSALNTLGRTIKRKITYLAQRIGLAEKILHWGISTLLSIQLQRKIDAWKNNLVELNKMYAQLTKTTNEMFAN